MQRSSDAMASSPRQPGSMAAALALTAAALLLSGCGLFGGPEPKAKPETAKPPVTADKDKPAAKPGAKPATPKPVAPKPVDKGDPEKRFAEALAQLKDNQIEEAEAAFKSLTEDFPTFSGPWTNLGILYAKSNRRNEAITTLSKAVTLNTSNTVAYNWLGMLYRGNKDLVRSEKAYLAALKADSNNALAHLNLGILYDDVLSRPADALPHYKEYQKLAGKDDLRVLAWIAEIEAALAKAPPPAPTPVPAATGAAPLPALAPATKPATRPVEPKR